MSGGHRLRARHALRVGPEHLRTRVSVRSLVTDPVDGEVATDVVGRLLAIDDEALVLVDRDGQLHVLDTRRVIASRPVPPHPRLPAEPDIGTAEAPLVRQAARLLLLDEQDRVLLVRHLPGEGAPVWTAPGGGLRPGEDHRDAALREAMEELGLVVTLGPVVWTRRETFPFRGVWLDQAERWFLARTVGYDAAAAPLGDHGTDLARWWTLDALRTTGERLAPSAFADHLRRIVQEGAPASPIDVGR